MEPLELKQILTAMRKRTSLESNQIETIKKAYWYAHTSYRRMEQEEKYRDHTIRLANRLLTEKKISSPDLLCGILPHHLDAHSLDNSLSKYFSPDIVDAARLLSPLHADNFSNEEAYWMALGEAPLPLRITKILDQIDHLEHAGHMERGQLLKETVEHLQPLADTINNEISSLLRKTAKFVLDGTPDPDIYRQGRLQRLSNFIIEHPEWISALRWQLYALGIALTA